jgi:hypothetical protein
MQKPIKHFLIIATVLAILSIIANVLVDNPYTHRLIRTALNRSIQAETNLVLDFKAIKASVVPPGVDLYGVKVAPKMAPQSPLFSTAQVKLRISLWALVLGDLRIGLIEAQEPTVLWPPPWDFPGFLKHPKPHLTESENPAIWPPAFSLPVDRIILNQARVAASIPIENTPPKPLSTLVTTLEGLDLDFTWKSWERMNGEIKLRSVNLALDNTSYLEETSMEASLSLRGDVVTLSDLKTHGERLSIEEGRGTLRIETAPQSSQIERLLIDTSTKVDGDLSLLGSFLDFSGTSGRIRGETRAEISIPIAAKEKATFKVGGVAEAQDARLFGYRLYNSKVRFEVDPKAVTFPDISVVIDKNRFARGTGVLRFDDKLSFEWNVKPERLRLLDLLDSLGVDFNYIDGALIADDLKIAGQGDPFELKVSAHAQFSDLLLPKTPYQHRGFPTPPQCRVDLNLLIDAEKMSFDGTHGLCFQSKELISPSKPGSPIAPPSDAFAVSPVSVTGGIHFDHGLNISIKSPALDLTLAQHFATIPMSGKAQVTTEIRGPFDRVQIASRVESGELNILDMPLGHVRGETLVTSDRLLWKNVVVTPPESQESASTDGSLEFDDDLTIRTRFRAGGLKRENLEKIFRAVAPAADFSFGIHQLQGDLAGPLLSPFAMLGRLTLDARNITQGQEVLADELHATIDAKDRGLSVEDLRVRLGSLSIGGQLRHRRTRPITQADIKVESIIQSLGILPEDHLEANLFTLQSEGNDQSKSRIKAGERADHLSRLPYAHSALKKAGIKGAIHFKAKIAGQMSHQFQGTVEGGITQAELLGSRIAPVGFSGFIQNSHIDVMLNHSGNALEGRMSFDLKAPSIPYEWYFSMRRLDLRALGSQYFYNDPRNYLYLTADWHMNGQLGDFWHSTGDLEIKGIRGKFVRDLAAQTKTLMVTQEKPVTLRFAKEGWSFDEGETLRLTGKYINLGLSMAKGSNAEQLGIQIDGTVDMAIAKEFSSQVDTAEGQVHFNASIGGPIESPSFKVDLEDLKPTPFTAGSWRPVTFGLAEMRPALRNIKLSARYDKGRLAISSFLADKGSGTVSASGSLGLTEDADEGSRLDVTLSDTTLIYTVAFLRSFETQVSGNLSLSGRGFPYKISGGINITKARSTKEVDIRDEIINVLRQKSFSAQVVQDKPTFLFDLKISADRTINIHNRNLQSVLSTNLSLQGSDISPQLLGQLEVNKGRFIYKRDFQISRGLVIFDDPVKPDPNLDILAVSEVDSYRVYIAITGRASNPTVEFSIDPTTRESGAAISKLEILVLLSRGKLPVENRSLGQETQSAAASEAANLILGQFEEPVEKLFDLSGQNVVRNVYIDTHPSPDGGPVPRLNLPLDIGEDFDVVLRADGQTNEVSTEYNVHENINFSGVLERRRADDQTQQTRRQGADFEAKVNLKFRFSFE